MPSTSKSQQRLFCMAYAVRKGELERSKVTKSVLDIADGDMTDEEIKDFMELKESLIKSFVDFVNEEKTVKNTKLRKLLDDAGYSDIELVKGSGYFYLVSNEPNSEHEKLLFSKDTDIYVNSFNQQTPEQWFDDIMTILTESFSLPKMKYVEENKSRYGTSYEIFSDDRKNVITCKLEQQFDLYYYEFDCDYDRATENSDEPFNTRHFAIFALNFIGKCNRANKAAGRNNISYEKAADELKKLK